ncbi:recombination-associated protein RdgC [Pseudomonas sp. S 311-6]|jgi:recombination associated protein RdgC|uniref:Recombination-associated protein RdgC n=1 Tax=Kerstersia gyiorum TaxID=206506 RepID=A0A4Q7MAI3_9BURK|nr:recombination-associated protein RdgC [Kerstersia gyiorum]AZV94155.1 recombination-associated protein RdgC [Bordetella sp. J329]MCO7637692.1 recombination-associated protein RdgC [Pseudomonas sp. S 311-6]KAB0541736.1 recombination-associated protein RdgC [Kerstersia gyiorum]MCH4270704.1 recombination-associated protein RdgC [Kerstersia gyiorum]MCI1229532.1 recombination-associated protein RdgC [Kerstersia gyiorum]
MWFKNLKLYRLNASWNPSVDELDEQLATLAFTPGNTSQPQTLGWTPVRENGRFAHAIGDQILISLRTEKKLLPSTVVNQVAKERAADFEAQQGYKPGRKQMKELKERIYDELLPRAFSISRDTLIWIDRKNRWLVIDAAASAKADEALGLLAKTLSPFPAEPLYVEQSPGAAMTSWLADDEAPAGFTIDQDTELRAAGDGKAAVRYVKHAPEPEELRRHIASGKQCTRLALTWEDRVSFVLTDALDIKRVAPLDVLAENSEAAGMAEDERFDADMTLMTGELAKLVTALVDALGGEKKSS